MLFLMVFLMVFPGLCEALRSALATRSAEAHGRGILGSKIDWANWASFKFAVSRSLGNEEQWGAMEKKHGKKRWEHTWKMMENDGKLWKMMEICTVSLSFVLYCFELFCALYFSLWAHYDISNLEIWMFGHARWELWFRLTARLKNVGQKLKKRPFTDGCVWK